MDSRRGLLAFLRLFALLGALLGVLPVVNRRGSLASRPVSLRALFPTLCFTSTVCAVGLWTAFSKFGTESPLLFLIEETVACSLLQQAADIHTCVSRRVNMWTFCKCVVLYLRRHPLPRRAQCRLLRLQAVLVFVAVFICYFNVASVLYLPGQVVLNTLYWAYLLALWTRLVIPKAALLAAVRELRRQCRHHTRHEARRNRHQEAEFWRSVLVRERVLYDLMLIESKMQGHAMLVFTLMVFVEGLQSLSSVAFSHMLDDKCVTLRPSKSPFLALVVFLLICYVFEAFAAESKCLARDLNAYLIREGARQSSYVKMEVVQAIVAINLQHLRNDVGGFIFTDVQLLKTVLSGVATNMFVFYSGLVAERS